MAWSRITGGANFGNFVATFTRTVTVTPGAANRAILVACGHSDTTCTFSVADTAGNTYTATSVRKTQAGSGAMHAFWALANGAGAITITVTYSVTLNASFGNMLVDVFDGNDTSAAPISAANSASGASGAPSSTLTPADNDCLLWGAANDSVTAVGAGFTKGADDTQSDWSEYEALTGGSGASQTVNFSGTSGAWILFMAAIKPAGGGGATAWGPLLGLRNNRLVNVP